MMIDKEVIRLAVQNKSCDKIKCEDCPVFPIIPNNNSSLSWSCGKKQTNGERGRPFVKLRHKALCIMKEWLAEQEKVEDPAPATTSPWGTAPDWAEWLAQDSSGGWYWYDTEPKLDDKMWYIQDGSALADERNAPNWRNSLQRRPKGNGE
jgi:hypothetical protein